MVVERRCVRLCRVAVVLPLSLRLDPVIVFAFSKKECEALAMQLSKLDLCDETERNQIEKVYFDVLPVAVCLFPTEVGDI